MPLERRAVPRRGQERVRNGSGGRGDGATKRGTPHQLINSCGAVLGTGRHKRGHRTNSLIVVVRYWGRGGSKGTPHQLISSCGAVVWMVGMVLREVKELSFL